ncbi:unnamed protein product [Bursaphelenchus okinawaensis]|uniref:Sema domain-containing protein n=1 Tax=Bursaphelenchus okinawaensis TaxID=465554 RepID=A0A811JT29_9BILA|nr:unnamed protein product [Bursaphelenchus okinawaensis]CAG9081830.1 unnamed protein product [Bursaphelenchus okinawaensis]
MALSLVLFSALFIFVTVGSTLIDPDNIFTEGDIGYDSLAVNAKTSSLYVGAKGHIFKLWLYNINDTNLSVKRVLSSDANELEDCIRSSLAEQECYVRVRKQFVKSDGNLIVCVSNAMKPILHQIDGSSLKDLENPRSAIGICSPHPEVNATAVYVEYGNPDDVPSIYSGIRTGQSLENHLIYRPPLVFNNKEIQPALRSVFTDSKWLNDPQFVGSFAVNQYVYFFFREVAVETENCGHTVYSRVARVCKNDLGGKNVLRQVWSSFVKARLNCSVSGASFNFLYSVSMVDMGNDMSFYGVFGSSEGSRQSSAVCHFSLRSINHIFDTGLFLEQPSVQSVWSPTPLEKIPAYRPGSCYSDSRSLPDSELHFAKSHLLMAESVNTDGEVKVFDQEPLGQIVADPRDNSVVLFVHNSRQNVLHKLLHWYDQRQFRLLASYTLPSEKVNSIAILPGEYFFISTSQNVAQYRLGQCPQHLTCYPCSSDPYCSWNIARSECFSRDAVHSTAVGWITDISNADKCRNYVRSETMKVFPGDSVHLKCGDQADSIWEVDKVKITSDSDNIVRTSAGGLVILNATRSVSGTYQCSFDGMPLLEYVVLVDDADCAQPKTVAQFQAVQREWCKKLEHYKTNVSKWQRIYNENGECPRIPPEITSKHKKIALQ